MYSKNMLVETTLLNKHDTSLNVITITDVNVIQRSSIKENPCIQLNQENSDPEFPGPDSLGEIYSECIGLHRCP
jgi:hypothetical protein